MTRFEREHAPTCLLPIDNYYKFGLTKRPIKISLKAANSVQAIYAKFQTALSMNAAANIEIFYFEVLHNNCYDQLEARLKPQQSACHLQAEPKIAQSQELELRQEQSYSLFRTQVKRPKHFHCAGRNRTQTQHEIFTQCTVNPFYRSLIIFALSLLKQKAAYESSDNCFASTMATVSRVKHEAASFRKRNADKVEKLSKQLNS